MHHRFALPGLALALGLAVLPGTPAAQPVRKSLYDRTLAGTILVSRPKDFGSGWVVDRARRLAVTNYHVVRDEPTVSVNFPLFKEGKVVAEKSVYTSAKQVKAKVLAIDKVRDLALLQLISLPPRASELKLASVLPDPGDRVHSIGNPARSDARWIYTAGTVRQVYRKQWGVFLANTKETLNLSARILEIQSPINGGDSGGPLVNDRGELVGVVQGGAKNATLINYAIAVTEVQEFLRANRQTSTRVATSTRKAPSKTSKTAQRARGEAPVKSR
jgi:S1-C subfamily serine protease